MPDSEKTVACIAKWVELAMHFSMHSFILFSKENNISMSQVAALFHLRRNGSEGVTDIGEHLGITSAAASQLVERLVQQKLVERTEDPNDRRVRQLNLTDKGLEFLQEGMRARQRWMGALAASLSPDEQAQVNQALGLLIEKTQALVTASGEDTAA